MAEETPRPTGRLNIDSQQSLNMKEPLTLGELAQRIKQIQADHGSLMRSRMTQGGQLPAALADIMQREGEIAEGFGGGGLGMVKKLPPFIKGVHEGGKAGKPRTMQDEVAKQEENKLKNIFEVSEEGLPPSPAKATPDIESGTLTKGLRILGDKESPNLADLLAGIRGGSSKLLTIEERIAIRTFVNGVDEHLAAAHTHALKRGDIQAANRLASQREMSREVLEGLRPE